MSEKREIPVIDLFAGPGGLGEGFSAVLNNRNERVFDIKLSIEMSREAHKTLELRSFIRQFPLNDVPEEYYGLLQEPDLNKKEDLRKKLFEKYPQESSIAKEEAWCAELGSDEFPSNVVDSRISKALNGSKNWALIGGPPCQAYSLVGRARRQLKENLDNTDVRVHLYKEYLRIIAVHHPAIFVMENVKGLLSAKLDGQKIFPLIKDDLSNPSTLFPNLNSPNYKIYSLTTVPNELDQLGMPSYGKDSDFLIRSEEYGVPQKRHRVILLGIREDINRIPEILEPSKKLVTTKEVIGDLPRIRSGLSKTFQYYTFFPKKKRNYKNEKDTNLNWETFINRFRRDIISWNGFAKEYKLKNLTSPTLGIGGEFINGNYISESNPLKDWYEDQNLGGVCNHESRAHLTQDLKRYMFSSMFTKTYNRFPRLHEFESHSKELLPEHENVNSGKFSDRFRVQVPDQPATTITSHISKDGHYFIHYDPDQCRSLTVREAARIQTFPDNYLFCGSRTAQFHQVGNAVPPFLAKQIGEIVKGIFETK